MVVIVVVVVVIVVVTIILYNLYNCFYQTIFKQDRTGKDIQLEKMIRIKKDYEREIDKVNFWL